MSDPELEALSMIDAKVLCLPLPTQHRIVRWLADRVESDQFWADEAARQASIEADVATPPSKGDQ